MKLIPFITRRVADPWTSSDEKRFLDSGDLTDSVIYIPSIHAKLRLEEENVYICSIKTRKGVYKNIHLIAETRRSFYFLAYIPQICLAENLKKANVDRNLMPQKSFYYNLLGHYDSYISEDGYDFSDEVCVLNDHLLIKVNTSIMDFFDRYNRGVFGEEIEQKYELLNNLYAKIVTEYFAFLNDENIKKQLQKYNLYKLIKNIGIRLAIFSLLGYSLDFDSSWSGIEDVNIDFYGDDGINLDYVSEDYLDYSLSNEYTTIDDNSYNVSFGKKYHVQQIGGGLGNADVDITKVPGTSHQYQVKFHGKIIAYIDSILKGTQFYVPTIGNCKIV